MALTQITYNNKSNYQSSSLANEYKVTASDMNEIKSVVNGACTQIDSSINYSGVEHVIGSWIDGKPIYRKVIHLGTLTNSGTTIVSSGLDSSIVRMHNVYGIAMKTDDYETIPLPFTWGDNSNVSTYIGLFFAGTSSNGNIWCRSNKSNASSYDAYAILEYTKTTD